MNNKGEYDGTCNITSCSVKHGVHWYNHSTRKYYCAGCAKRLNADLHNNADAMKMFGHMLLTLGKHD